MAGQTYTAKSKNAEIQSQLSNNGFMQKTSFAEVLSPLVQGAVIGLQNRDAEIQAEKKAKARAAAAEAKRLRKEQQAAEKLEKEILETAQSVALQNNLNVNPSSPIIAHLVKTMTIAGRASFSDAETALSKIENTYQFGEGMPTLNAEGAPFSLKFVNKTKVSIDSETDLGQLKIRLDNLPFIPSTNAIRKQIKARMQALQKGGPESDKAYLEGVTAENINSRIAAFDNSDYLSGNSEQRARVLTELKRMAGLDEYKIPFANNPLRDSTGNFLDKYQLEALLLKDTNLDDDKKIFNDEQRAIAESLTAEDPATKTPVTELNAIQTVAERGFLQQKQNSFNNRTDNLEEDFKDLTADEKERLDQLNVQYDAFVQAGKINPAGEAVVKDYAAMSINRLLNEQTLLIKKKDDLLDGEALSSEDEIALATINTLVEAEQNMPDSVLPDWLTKDIPANINADAKLNEYEPQAKSRLAVLLDKINTGKATAEESKEYVVVNRRVGYLEDVRRTLEEKDEAGKEPSPVKLTTVGRTLDLFINPNNPLEGVIQVRVRETEDGSFKIMTGHRRGLILPTADPRIAKVGMTDAQNLDLTKVINRNDEFSEKLLSLRENASLLTKSSYQLAQFVSKNDSILSIGATTEFISKIGNSIDAAMRVFTDRNIMPSEKQLAKMASAALAQASQETGLVDKIKEVGALYGQFHALATKHAFAFAKISLDTKGQAMSNLDYKNSFEINVKGSDYDSFMPNLMDMTQSVIEQAVSKYNGYLSSDLEHQAALNVLGYKENFDKTTLGGTLESYLEQDATEAYAWINKYMQDGEIPPKITTPSEDVAPKPNASPKTIPIETFFTDLTNDTARSDTYARIIGTVINMGNNPNIDSAKATRDLEALVMYTAKQIYGDTPNSSQLAAIKGQLMAKFRRTN